MKRSLCITAVLIMLLSAAACGSDEPAPTPYTNDAMGISLLLPSGTAADDSDGTVLRLSYGGNAVPCITLRRYNIPSGTEFFPAYNESMSQRHADDQLVSGAVQEYTVGNKILHGNLYVYERDGQRYDELSLLLPANGYQYLFTSVQYSGGESVWEALEYVIGNFAAVGSPADPTQTVSIAMAPDGIGSGTSGVAYDESQMVDWISGTYGFSIKAHEGVIIREESDGIYLYPVADGVLPYVMVYGYQWAGVDAESFFASFDDALLASNPGMTAGQSGTFTVDGVEYPSKTYSYKVQGYDVTDTRVLRFENGYAYVFTAKEIEANGDDMSGLLESTIRYFRSTAEPEPSPSASPAPSAG